MARKTSLRLERLEDRTVPALFGIPWADARYLTLSFAPDGTNVDGAGSTLSSVVGGGSSAWLSETMRAVQTWTAYANVNINLVWDSGTAFGAAGAPQGDNRFGDIRIAARPLSDNVVAITTPSGYVGGTRVGDIVLNSNADFNIGGTDNHYDIYSVLLQEFGHALGLSNSSDPASVMFEAYSGVRTGLSAGDIANVRALYGARNSSANAPPPTVGPTLDDWHTNDTLNSATSLSDTDGYADNTRYSARAKLRDVLDVDYFKVRSPQANSNQPNVLTVNVRALNPGALSPVVQLYDEDRRLVSANILANGNGTYTVQLPDAASNKDYYIRVAAGNVGGTGDYQLDLNFRSKVVTLESYADGTLTPTAVTEYRTLTANRSQVMHFVLSATSANAAVPSGVRMTIFDNEGHVKATLFAKAGQTLSQTLFLEQGDYTVRFEGLSPVGTLLTSLTYSLCGVTLTDPIGPTGSDPTLGDGGTVPNDNDWTQELLDYYASLLLEIVGDPVW